MVGAAETGTDRMCRGQPRNHPTGCPAEIAK
jgi:hypothetical protein